MEFSISRNVLQKELGFVQGVVERKNTIPVLSNIVIQSVGESTVRLFGTDLDVTIRSDAEAESIKASGSICVQAKKLFDIARFLPDAPVNFKLESNDWVTIKCGRASFRLPGIPRENFPELPENKSVPVSIPSQLIRDFINRTIFAITQEEGRYTLSGAKFIVNSEGARMITTDGHRMVYISTLQPVNAGVNQIDTLIPRKALAEMSRLAASYEGDVRMGSDENHIYFEVGPRLLISRLLTGQFPNYEMVMPKNNTNTVVFDGQELNNALRLISTVSEENSHAIKLQLQPGSFTIKAQSSDYGEGEQVLEADYDGPEITVGFNHRYLQEFLTVMADRKVAIDFKDSQSQAQLRPLEDPDYECKYVVMPLRV